MNLRNNIFALVTISFFGNIFGKGVRYSLNVLISNGFGADALGLFAFGMVVMKFGAIISKLGLDNAILKFVPTYSGDVHSRSGIIAFCLVVPIISGAVIASMILLIFNIFPQAISPRQYAVVRLFIVGIPLYSITMIGLSAMRSFNDTKFAVLTRDFTQSIIALAATVLAIEFAYGLNGAVFGYVFSFVVAVLLSIYLIKHLGGFQGIREAKFPISEVISFSVPLTIVAVTQYMISWTDTLMLGLLAPASELGAYYAAFQTAVLLLIVLQAVNTVFPPLASGLYTNKQWPQMRNIYSTITKWIFSLTLLGTVFLFIFDSTVLAIFGIKSEAAEQSLLVLSIGQLIAVGVGPASFLLAMTGNERLETLNTISVSLFNIILNYIFIVQYGIVGAALGTAISLAALNIVRITEIWWKFRIIPISIAYLKPLSMVLLASVIMVLVQRISPPNVISAGVGGALGLIGFGLGMMLVGFDKEDKTLIKSLADI